MKVCDSIADAFRPVIHSEDGEYWAEIPAMPGCFTVADSLDDLKGNILEAMKCWLLTSIDMERTIKRRAAAAKHQAPRTKLTLPSLSAGMYS